MNTTTDTTTVNSAAPLAPLDTVQSIYGAFGRGDFDSLFDQLDPDIDWGAQIDVPGAELVPMPAPTSSSTCSTSGRSTSTATSCS